MSDWAKPGVKCVFIGIGAGLEPDMRDICMPETNQTYTIRDVVVSRRTGACLLRFEEIVNPRTITTEGYLERAYEVQLFRPLVSKKDDLKAHFYQHLNHTAPADLVPAE